MNENLFAISLPERDRTVTARRNAVHCHTVEPAMWRLARAPTGIEQG